MRKIVVLLLLITAIAVIFCGCGAPKTDDGGGETITIVDHNGNEVTLPKDIERIAVIDIFPLPSVIAVFFNSADKIKVMSTSSMSAAQTSLLSELYPEILDADTSAVSGSDVNLEELMKADPQVVFYAATNAQLGKTLTNAGFNAVAVSSDKWNFNAIETLQHWIELLSQIFPESGNDRYRLVKEYSDRYMKLVKDRTEDIPESERARVFFLFQYSNESILTSGSNFFGQWWADVIGAVNVGEELDGVQSVKVTMEQIYLWNPDTVLITNFTEARPSDLYENNIGNYDWSEIDAVKTRRVFKMPLGMYRSYTPGIDNPVTLVWLAKTVYPELFEDVDITEITKEYYKEVFGVELTKAQAERIFTPPEGAGKVSL